MRLLRDAAPTDRVGRYPKHTFRVNSQPFTAQPFMIARVLPGETLQNIYMESRVVTDPVLSPIIGWKHEYFFFYVKITDLGIDAMKEIFVDPTNAEVSGYDEAANIQAWYCAKGAVDWTKKCLDRVVNTYFRDDGEVAADHKLANNVPLVQIRESTFLDSITDKDDLPEGAALSGATDAGDLDRLMDAFEQLRMLGLSDMTYEDWLRSNGIAIPNKDENKPEMLMHISEFSYPSNTIDPATGLPSSALSWVFKKGQGKRFFFKEPGFILGLSVTRPKIYFSGLAGSAAGFAQRAWDWMPNYLRDVPETSLKGFTAGQGPLGDRLTDSDSYWIDMRDELIHGDQFQNVYAFPANSADPAAHYADHMLPLPNADAHITWKYPVEADVKGFFKDAAGTAYYVKQDGYVSLNIKGHEVDFTQAHIAQV